MKYRAFASLMLALLVVQFILGMLANLYSKIPQQKSYEVFHHFGFIVVHAYNGVLLLALAIIFLVQTVRKGGDRRPVIGGLANISIAFVCGEIFVVTQNDIWSLVMAIAFLGAFASYARIVFSERGKS